MRTLVGRVLNIVILFANYVISIRVYRACMYAHIKENAARKSRERLASSSCARECLKKIFTYIYMLSRRDIIKYRFTYEILDNIVHIHKFIITK